MRLMMTFVAALLIVTGLSTALPLPTWTDVATGTAIVAAQGQQAPSGKLDVDINVNRGGQAAWWTNPVWIAIGGIGLVLLIVIVAMIARGGGTTVIKE